MAAKKYGTPYPPGQNHHQAHDVSSRVLLLGAGMVAKPALDDLSQSGIDVTIGLLPPRRDEPMPTRPLTPR